jgi:metallo-beta-lactamase class B
MNKIFLSVILTMVTLKGLPQSNFTPTIISRDLELIKISEDAYVHVSYDSLPGFGRYSSNGLILIDRHDAFLFDTPTSDSLTKTLVTFLKLKMGIKITGFIPNHWHNDCMGGLAYLQSQSVESYANQKTIEIAAIKHLPIPTHGFKDSIQLKLGDKMIYCYFPGPAHSLDNIVVWIPSKKILFPGCMCKSLDSENLGNVADGNTADYPGTIEKVIGKFKSAKIVIPGHGRIGGLDLLQHTKDLAERYKK